MFFLGRKWITRRDGAWYSVSLGEDKTRYAGPLLSRWLTFRWKWQ